jgi:hypothetical protein
MRRGKGGWSLNERNGLIDGERKLGTAFAGEVSPTSRVGRRTPPFLTTTACIRKAINPLTSAILVVRSIFIFMFLCDERDRVYRSSRISSLRPPKCGTSIAMHGTAENFITRHKQDSDRYALKIIKITPCPPFPNRPFLAILRRLWSWLKPR